MKNRLQILNTRGYGDEESYVRVKAFAGNDPTDLIDIATDEYRENNNIAVDAPLIEENGQYLYVNDDITLQDGQILIGLNGTRFRINITKVRKEKVNGLRITS